MRAMEIAARAFALVERDEDACRYRFCRQPPSFVFRAVAPNDVLGLGQRRHFVYPSAERGKLARLRPTRSAHDAIDFFWRAGNRFFSTPHRTSKIATASGASSNACVASARANICESFASHGRWSSWNLRPRTKK